MNCPICEHIQEHREWITERLAETKDEPNNFRVRAGLKNMETFWNNAWDMHRQNCEEQAA